MIVPTANITAVVPARRGSKGIHQKNVQSVAGKPLIVWTLLAVAEAKCRIRLLVTTDCPDVAEIASHCGAEVVTRPEALARDDSPTEPALVHALESAGVPPQDVVVFLQPTSPVRLSGSIDRAILEFSQSQVDSCVGVVEQSPFLWNGSVENAQPHYDTGKRLRRQEFSPEKRIFRETGSVYVFRCGPFVEAGDRIHGRVRLFVMDNVEGIDVDSPEDLAMATMILNSLKAGAREDC